MVARRVGSITAVQSNLSRVSCLFFRSRSFEARETDGSIPILPYRSSIAQVSTLLQQRLIAQQATVSPEDEENSVESTPVPSEDEVASAIEASLVMPSGTFPEQKLTSDLASLEWTRNFIFFASLASSCGVVLQRTKGVGSAIAGIGIGIECDQSIGVRRRSSASKVCSKL